MGNRPSNIPIRSETVWAMQPKDFLDFKYPKISLAFLDTFSAMEKVSEQKSRATPVPLRRNTSPYLGRGASFGFQKVRKNYEIILGEKPAYFFEGCEVANFAEWGIF